MAFNPRCGFANAKIAMETLNAFLGSKHNLSLTIKGISDLCFGGRLSACQSSQLRRENSSGRTGMFKSLMRRENDELQQQDSCMRIVQAQSAVGLLQWK